MVLESSDAGATWHADPPPPGSATLSAISCVPGAVCTVVGAARSADPYSLPPALIASSGDSGASWADEQAPQDSPFLSGVSCVSLVQPDGGASSATPTTGASQASPGAPEGCWTSVTFNGVLATTDSGAGWGLQGTPVPGNPVTLASISCAGSGSCVASGQYYDATSATERALLIANGAAASYSGSWSVLDVPAGLYFLKSVDCATPYACVAVGDMASATGSGAPAGDTGQAVIIASSNISASQGPSWSVSEPPGASMLSSVSCASASDCVAVGEMPVQSGAFRAGVAFESLDGGASWKQVTLPGGVGPLDSVTCSGPSLCIAAGSSYGGTAGPPAQSPVVLYSRDGGQSWSYGSVPTEAPVPLAGAPGGDALDGSLSTLAGSLASSGLASDVGQSPYGMAVYGDYVYASDFEHDVVRRIDLATGMETVVAGNAGGGVCAYATDAVGDGCPGTQAVLGAPAGLAVDGSGDLFIADQNTHRVRELAAYDHTQFGIQMLAGHIYTVAGDGIEGSAGNGVPGTQAELNDPSGLAIDAAGNLYIADQQSALVRELAAVSHTQFSISMQAGDIYTIAGTGVLGRSPTGTPAASAELAYPQGLAVDSEGDLFISEDVNGPSIYEIPAVAESRYGQSMVPGNMYLLAGSASICAGATDALGDGCPATEALLTDPAGIAIGPSGNLYTVDYYDHRVRRVSAANGIISTVAGGATSPCASALDRLGDGCPATQAILEYPTGLTFDPAGNLLIADSADIREVSPSSGLISNLAGTEFSSYSGNGAPATQAELGAPCGVAVGPDGSIFIADPATNTIRMVAAANTTAFGIQMTAGDIYAIAGNGIGGEAPDGADAAESSFLVGCGVAVDSHGDVFFDDLASDTVREVAAYDHTQFSIAMRAGDVYTVIGSTSAPTPNPPGGLPCPGATDPMGDGCPAALATLDAPGGLAMGPHGDLFVADSGDNLVRELSVYDHTQFGIRMAAGDVYALAGSPAGSYPCVSARDAVGDGCPATHARLSDPTAVALGPRGNLFVADTGDQRVRMVMARDELALGSWQTQGEIETILGDGFAGDGGGGGPAGLAELTDPSGLALDPSGDLFVADTGNDVVEEVSPVSGLVHVVAGTGANGYGAGGTGPTGATDAVLADPTGLAVTASGELIIADTGNSLLGALDGFAPMGSAYWLASASGAVHAFGDAAYYGSLVSGYGNPNSAGSGSGSVPGTGSGSGSGSPGTGSGSGVTDPVVAMAATPDGRGYWLASASGAVHAFGDAAYYGSMSSGPVSSAGQVVALCS